MTRVLLDACVLYPSILRSVLMGCASKGLFDPVWSPRILEEWRRAAERNGIGAEAAIEIALLRADWATAEIVVADGREDGIFLPDANDVHVLAAAIEAQADELLTANISDFPSRVLGEFGIIRRHPDHFLFELASDHGAVIRTQIDEIWRVACDRNGSPVNRKKMLQKAGLPRLAKWDQAQGG